MVRQYRKRLIRIDRIGRESVANSIVFFPFIFYLVRCI